LTLSVRFKCAYVYVFPKLISGSLLLSNTTVCRQFGMEFQTIMAAYA